MASHPSNGALLLGRIRSLAMPQGGVFTTAQALAAGVSYEVIRGQLSAARWTRLHEGVYLLGNMRPGETSRRWAGLLASGDGAVLSHATAARIYGFGPSSHRIHVSIPAERVDVTVPGVRLHRSRLLPAKGTNYLGWPITTPADTVLDLVADLRSPHDVVALLTDACRSKSVAAEEILQTMGRRKRQRHRQLVKDVLADVVGGVHSVLEHRYLIRVERAHGLPVGRRQVKVRVRANSIYEDVEYDEYATVVELDGRLGHEGSGQHRDRRRDNANTVGKKATLRYGHADLTNACEVALEVASVLRSRGWRGTLKRCGPRCLVTT